MNNLNIDLKNSALQPQNEVFRIKKIFNNNVAVIKKNGKEQVVCGKGIAFSKKVGDPLDMSRVTQIFVLKEARDNIRFQEIIQNIPLEYIEVTNEIIEMFKLELGKKINDIIYVSLSDHIHAAIKRAEEGIYLPNTMNWEIAHYYENEYALALKALEIIRKKTGVELKNDEASFIALHIINSETENSSLEETTKVTRIIREVLKIVRNHLQKDISNDSVHFYRFITHIKFFAHKLVYEKAYRNDNNELLEIIKNKYQNSYNCVEAISKMIYQKYNYQILQEEKLYLTIHVHRLAHNNGNN
ncbi:BglG family transcription antiterminator LicT [Dubosiella newyorkensis]|uniref:BglG family transcription antiterminator LicT n=3 Tax=Dubosiella newyorkensis TaxID=1862672 RepID=UPI0023EFC9B7|nr:PRD domain-containing protein [Dubosiella newyorkensis]